MKRFNSFHAINVFSLELEHWAFEPHKHNFYELIFIEKGSGVHLLNDLSFHYKKGHVFLLAPEDVHEFVIHEKTTFTYIKFTEQVFIEKLGSGKNRQWEEALKHVLGSYQIKNGCIIGNLRDKKHAFQLVQMLLHEYTSGLSFHHEAVLELFGALMVIVTRNLNNSRAVSPLLNKETEKLNNILTYIRIHALDGDKMKIGNLAAHFLMSPNYISIYVKKHTGLPLQQHIMQTRLKQADKLLQQNRLTINQVAERLGFNDASHFNKLFRKYRQVNPSKFTTTA